MMRRSLAVCVLSVALLLSACQGSSKEELLERQLSAANLNHDLEQLSNKGVISKEEIPAIKGYLINLNSQKIDVYAMTYGQVLAGYKATGKPDSTISFAKPTTVPAGSNIAEAPKTDSVCLRKATGEKVCLGMSTMTLEEMIDRASADLEHIDKRYKEAPLNQKIDIAKGPSIMHKYLEDNTDAALYGNVLMYKSAKGEDISKYTYGQILAIAGRVKSAPEFAGILRKLEAHARKLKSPFQRSK